MDLALRSAVIFFFVFLLMRIVGRRELSSLEPFDLILLVVLGDSVQQAVTQDDYSVTGAFIVVSTIALLQVFMSYLNFRVPRLRPIIDGEPIVIVQDGRVIEGNARRERLTLDGGILAVMSAVDLELGYGGLKTYAAFGYDDTASLFCSSRPGGRSSPG